MSKVLAFTAQRTGVRTSGSCVTRSNVRKGSLHQKVTFASLRIISPSGKVKVKVFHKIDGTESVASFNLGKKFLLPSVEKMSFAEAAKLSTDMFESRYQRLEDETFDDAE
ncbi:hypothetical protein [Serratia fonticola]|uniref:Uncharacterized protein n=1 Tax=Serratia fonticola TaxID=47917 RepID=A0ABY9PS24_SERFO|nr:hypothetical protein [Serratia fonticola]WMT16038.1 hypothetical protein RFB13_06835 [Serratia fonticola]